MCRAYTYHTVRNSVVERRGTSDSLVAKSGPPNGTPPRLAPPPHNGGGSFPLLLDGTRTSTVVRSPVLNGDRTFHGQKETVFAT
jgi:hypothetical protein